jgi:hypothetical protein
MWNFYIEKLEQLKELVSRMPRSILRLFLFLISPALQRRMLFGCNFGLVLCGKVLLLGKGKGQGYPPTEAAPPPCQHLLHQSTCQFKAARTLQS